MVTFEPLKKHIHSWYDNIEKKREGGREKKGRKGTREIQTGGVVVSVPQCRGGEWRGVEVEQLGRA